MAKTFIKWMDDLPWLLQIIFCIPLLDIVWGVYRVVKGLIKEDGIMLIVGILWIIPGTVFGWVVDLVTTIVWKRRLIA